MFFVFILGIVAVILIFVYVPWKIIFGTVLAIAMSIYLISTKNSSPIYNQSHETRCLECNKAFGHTLSCSKAANLIVNKIETPLVTSEPIAKIEVHKKIFSFH